MGQKKNNLPEWHLKLVVVCIVGFASSGLALIVCSLVFSDELPRESIFVAGVFSIIISICLKKEFFR